MDKALRDQIKSLEKAFRAQKEMLDEMERQRKVASGASVTGRTLDELSRTIKTTEAFRRLSLKERRALFQYCNAFIANIMALVLGHDHQALLSKVDSSDGLAILESLDARADESTDDPVARRISSIKRTRQDQGGTPRDAIYFFNRLEQSIRLLVQLCNRKRRRKIKNGALQEDSLEAETKEPHEFLAQLKGILPTANKSVV